MDTSEETRAAELAANELYWGSDKSVNQIADELDLSKGALYGMIRPRRSGLGCPLCGDEVISPNRTARDRGILGCPSCAWEGDEGDALAYGSEGGVTIPTYDDVDPVAPPPGSSTSIRTRVIAGGALLGAAAGLALVMWSRRR